MKRRNKEQWQEIIKKQQLSGLSAAQFCRNEQIDQKYFSKLKRQLLEESKIIKPIFTKVKIKHQELQHATIKYTYKNSTLKFNQLPDAKWLGELLSSLT
jgi:ribosomal protein S18